MIDFFKGINLWEIDKIITTIISKLSITKQNAITCVLLEDFHLVIYYLINFACKYIITKVYVLFIIQALQYCRLIDPFQSLDKRNNRSSQTWFNLRQRVCITRFSGFNMFEHFSMYSRTIKYLLLGINWGHLGTLYSYIMIG